MTVIHDTKAIYKPGVRITIYGCQLFSDTNTDGLTANTVNTAATYEHLNVVI